MVKYKKYLKKQFFSNQNKNQNTNSWLFDWVVLSGMNLFSEAAI